MKSFKRTAVGVLRLTIAATLFSAPNAGAARPRREGSRRPDPVFPGRRPRSSMRRQCGGAGSPGVDPDQPPPPATDVHRPRRGRVSDPRLDWPHRANVIMRQIPDRKRPSPRIAPRLPPMAAHHGHRFSSRVNVLTCRHIRPLIVDECRRTADLRSVRSWVRAPPTPPLSSANGLPKTQSRCLGAGRGASSSGTCLVRTARAASGGGSSGATARSASACTPATTR